jgi:hypothetical protein
VGVLGWTLLHSRHLASMALLLAHGSQDPSFLMSSFASLISWRSRKKRLLAATYTAESLDHMKTKRRGPETALSETFCAKE